MKKKVIILEVIATLVAFVLYAIFIGIPDYRKQLGSSDSYIKVSDYCNMIEISIDDSVDFSLLLNEKSQVYHIFFFDKNARCLYNQNIEGNSYEKASLIVISKLIEFDYLKVDSKIKMIRYGDFDYDKFSRIFKDNLLKYSISTPILEDVSTLNDKASVLNIDAESQSMILRVMDFYSKDAIRVPNM